MIEQPNGTDDVSAWRRYAGELRQALGAARRAAETREDQYEILRKSKIRDTKVLDALERDLNDGDVPHAIDRLQRRRERINASRARRP